MNIITSIIIITALAGVGGTGLGGVIAALFKKDSSKTVSLLLSFAGGVMLAIVCFDLIVDAISPHNAEGNVNIFLVILGIVVGYGVIYLLNYFIDKKTNKEVAHIDKDHPKTADDLGELIHSDHFEEHRHMAERDAARGAHRGRHREGARRSSSYQLFIAGVVMAVAIALHNLPEGMVIGATYAIDPSSLLSSSALSIAIVIGLHNIPEGMAVSVPLISGGMSRTKAVLITALSGAPTILGAILGYYIGIISPLALSLSLSFASGAMLYVVFGELFPESILMWRSKMPAAAALLGLLVGLLIIYV